MVELQSCSDSLVNSSALCPIEQEVKANSTTINVIAEISAELRREREKNAELMKRISILEAQIQGRDKESSLTNGHEIYLSATERSHEKFKRQRIVKVSNGIEDGDATDCETASQIKHHVECFPSKEMNMENQVVTWISMDETQLLHVDKLKDDSFAAECNDTDDTDKEEDYEEADTSFHHKSDETHVNLNKLDAHVHPHCASHANQPKEHVHQDDVDRGINMPCLGSFFDGQGEPELPCTNEETNSGRKNFRTLPGADQAHNRNNLQEEDKKEAERNKNSMKPKGDPRLEEAASHEGLGGISYVRKPPKVAFCPKEVKRMLESEVLLLKNAQSHTIRKIIVFASLGIRHGCEDMYELDFNHFSILRKGEPHVSQQDPGEHVLYENPGVRRKILYPNRKNPILCPIQILEEERAMRPSDPSCPSWLFLCIKYGGRTRNLPQNEYVRQRMGRNKLKSFGPFICRMAMLVHIRSGSFFFKALGITLLFMAGFPDDLVQSETKCQSLDLLQKYYRTDKDAEGENLFLLHPVAGDTVRPQLWRGKIHSTRSKGKKQASSRSRPCSLPGSSVHHSAQPNSALTTQFGLMGYDSVQTHSTALFKSMQCQNPPDISEVPRQVTKTVGSNVTYHDQTPYHMFPTQAGNAFMHMPYWSAPNAFPPIPCALPSVYDYRHIPCTMSYISIHPQPYYSYQPYGSFIPKSAAVNEKNDMALDEEADSDSDSSSSSTEPKEA